MVTSLKDTRIKALMTYTPMGVYKEEIEALGYDLDVINLKEVGGNIDFDKYEVLISYDAFSKIDVTKMKNLKLIVLSSIGIDQVPKYFLDPENSVMITHNHGGYSIAIGEWIVMTLLMGLKNTNAIYNDMKNKKWHMYMNLRELYKKKVLILGTGTLAVNAAERLRAFGVEIVGMNRRGSHVESFDRVVSVSDVMDEMRTADAVVSCLPRTDKTDNFLDYKKLSAMKDDSILVNVSRGSVLDEEALIKLLEEDKYLFVALDVYKREPLNRDSRLYDFDRVFLSSHNSWVSEERDDRRYKYFYSVLKSYANGEKPMNLVDKYKGY